jgi:eukaryotic-like serine/threonine-protein kinase
MKIEQSTRVRLGSFELNLKTGELCALDPDSDGQKVLLQEQPFRMLRILIDHAGEIASRKEIRKRLWPNDTIVDFDHNINVAIRTLRRAFGDSAVEPKYIETVARRGYRLLVPVERVESLGDQPMAGPNLPLSGNGRSLHHPNAGLIGRKVSHFRVLELIGGGGMGMVYKAEDLKLGRWVALKFLPEELAHDPLALKRFEREAQTASSLNHANICTIFETEEFEGQPVIVMELLHGETLRDHLAVIESKRMPLDQLLEIGLQTCDGLQAAHARGIIHRDVKPANIFLTTNGPAKILDFGLAKLVETEEPAEDEQAEAPPSPSGSANLRVATADDTNLTRTGMAVGTANYMSPEQARKEKLDARTDLFSFGLVLYEMATGRRAFLGDNATSVQQALLNQTPAPVHDLNPAVPPALEKVIAKALEKDRAQRYQSAAEMRKDLTLVSSSRSSKMRPIRKSIGIAALLLVVAAAAITGYRYRTRYRLSASDTIVIADLTNQTSDPVLDDALNLALPIEVAQTPFLQVLAQDKVRETMVQLNHPQDGKVTPEIGREVCLKTNSDAVITSSISDEGNRFHIELTGINCQSGKTFARSSQDARLRSGIVHALGVAGADLRLRMGEPAESVNRFNKPLELATSSSLEALQFLAKGFRNHLSTDFATTMSYYERAIDLDPSFALAYASAGIVYTSTGRVVQAVAAEKKAYELRDRLTGQLRFLAETLYFDLGLGDLERSYPVYQEWIRTFPLDGVAHNNFAVHQLSLGRYDESAAEAREALRLMPLLGAGSYLTLMRAATFAGHPEEAKLIYAEAKARKTDVPIMHLVLFLLAFQQHDKAAMEEQLVLARKEGDQGRTFISKAKTEVYDGRLSQVRPWLVQAAQMSQKSGNPDVLDQGRLELALAESEVGTKADVARTLTELGPSAQDRNTRMTLMLAFTRVGDVRRADNLAEAVDREAPHDTLVQKFSLPTVRAAIKLNENKPETAIAILQPVEQFEFATTQSFDNLYPAYIRGLAYLQLGRGQEAAAEFQKLIDHPGVVRDNVIGALAYLQLGRSQMMKGDKAAARKAYQDFLTVWKEADPEIPIYKQAKAEFTKLQ